MSQSSTLNREEMETGDVVVPLAEEENNDLGLDGEAGGGRGEEEEARGATVGSDQRAVDVEVSYFVD